MVFRFEYLPIDKKIVIKEKVSVRCITNESVTFVFKLFTLRLSQLRSAQIHAVMVTSSEGNSGTDLENARKNIHYLSIPGHNSLCLSSTFCISYCCKAFFIKHSFEVCISHKAFLSGDAFRPIICERKDLSEEGGMIFLVP